MSKRTIDSAKNLAKVYNDPRLKAFTWYNIEHARECEEHGCSRTCVRIRCILGLKTPSRLPRF